MSCKTPQMQRLWRHVAKSDGCWEWQGYRNRKGYGVIGDPTQLAHRVVWRATRGEIPEGLCVCHRCDNPACCNPEHLFLGTNTDNMLDREQKGRWVPRIRGEGNVSAKLTEAQVRAIHADTRNQYEIAAAYGVAQSTVGVIKLGKKWKHLGLPVQRKLGRRKDAKAA